jgi:hypothetical protein
VETILPTLDEKVFVREHLCEEVSALALRLGRFPHLNAGVVLRQVAGYQALLRKVPTWAANPDLVFTDSLPLEQCSSEATARYKASILPSWVESIADLTGGLGVDFAFLATGKTRALYVERRPDLCGIALENFRVLGLTQAKVLNGDGSALLAEPFDLLYLDPARRDAQGGKVVALSDCEPDIVAIKSSLFANAPLLLVKLSPMLDISLAIKQLPETTEVHVVSVDGECKELLFLLDAENVDKEPRIVCVNLRSNAPVQSFKFTRSQEQSSFCRLVDVPNNFLYEPNASLLKAGAFSILTQTFNLYKLHPNSHLYTSETLVEDFPGRAFAIDAVFPVHPKDLKIHLGNLTKANITTRNFPETVAQLRKKTKLKEGGDTYLFATTLMDDRKVLVKCRKLY